MAKCTCQNCGATFDAKRRDAKYCGPDCRPPCTIDGCDRLFYSRGWCRKHYRRWETAGSPEFREPNPCVTCGLFVSVPKSGSLPKYCSSGCDPKRQPKRCGFCGKLLGVSVGKRKFCSVSCRDRSYRIPGGPPQRTCVRCGDPLDFDEVGPGGRRLKADTYTCKGCRRHGRPAMTVDELAARDGAECAICSEPVDLSLEWPDPLAPTVDHVVPWSLGGTHDPENLALAHATCNRRKSNRAA